MGKGKETLHKRKKRGREESSSCKETTAYRNSEAKAFRSSASSTCSKANKACFKSSSSTEKANKPSHYHRRHHRNDDNVIMRCTHNDDEKTDGCGLSMGSDENYVGGLGVFEFPWLKEGVSGLVCKTEEEDERWWGSDGSFSACLNEIMYNASAGGGGETEWWPDIPAAGGGFAFEAESMDKFEETASAWSSILEMEAAAAATTSINGNHHVDLEQPAA